MQKAPVYLKGELQSQRSNTTLPGKKNKRLNFTVIKYTGILIPPKTHWKQLKFLITFQILYLKREILDLQCYFLPCYVRGHNAIFRLTELVKGVLHSTSLVGICGKSEGKPEPPYL